MSKLEKVRQAVNLDFALKSSASILTVPLEMPCHLYALGIECSDYLIGELIDNIIDQHSNNCELIETLKEELEMLGLSLKECSFTECSILGQKRVIIITRNSYCYDYHFRLVLPDGGISEKFRGSKPQVSQRLELFRGEYLIGIYSVERASY